MNTSLKEPITAVKGIGGETAAALQEMEIHTVNDLLEHLPYRYEDYRLRDLETVEHEERVTVEGKIHTVPTLNYFGKKKSRLTIKLLTGRYLITVIFFNQPYLKPKLTIGDTVTVTGKWDRHRQTITGSECHVGDHSREKEFEPVYSVKGSITVKGMRRHITTGFSQFGNLIEEKDRKSTRLNSSHWE